MNQVRVQSFHAQQLPADDVIAAVDRGHAQFFAFQILNVFDEIRAHHQIIRTLFQENENRLHRQALHDAAKGADEGCRERHVAVQYRHGAEARIDLDEFDLQPLVFEETLGLSHVVRSVGVDAARQRDTDLLALRVGVLVSAKENA